MLVGGVFLVAGTVLRIADGDCHDGHGCAWMTVREVVACDRKWVTLAGQEKVPDGGPWCERLVQLKISAIKRSHDLTEPSLRTA